MTGQDTLAALLARCADGDQRALEVLYQATSRKLYGVALALLRREDLAEDVLQDAYIKVWHRARTYDASKGAPMTWMTSIVRNRALDLLRSVPLQMEHVSDNYVELEIPEYGQDSEMAATLELSTKAVVECLEQLSESQRRCILLAYYYGHTHDELANQLHTPLGTVKAWIRRGMEKLRECLG